MKCLFSARSDRGETNQQSPISPWFTSNLFSSPTNTSGLSSVPCCWHISWGLNPLSWIKTDFEFIHSPEPLNFTAVPGPAHVAELGPGVSSQQAVAGWELGILPQFLLLLAFLLELRVALIRIKLFDFITTVAHDYPLSTGLNLSVTWLLLPNSPSFGMRKQLKTEQVLTKDAHCVTVSHYSENMCLHESQIIIWNHRERLIKNKSQTWWRKLMI